MASSVASGTPVHMPPESTALQVIWISYSAYDALFPHPREGRHSILRAGQTPCELAHPSGVLHQSMASYCGALARDDQCLPPIGLEQRPSN